MSKPALVILKVKEEVLPVGEVLANTIPLMHTMCHCYVRRVRVSARIIYTPCTHHSITT